MKTAAFGLMINLIEPAFAGNRGSVLVRLLQSDNAEADEIPEFLRILEESKLYDAFQKGTYPVTSMALEIRSAFEHAKVRSDAFECELVQEMLSLVIDILAERVKARNDHSAIWGKFDDVSALSVAFWLLSVISEQNREKAADLLRLCGRHLNHDVREFLQKLRRDFESHEAINLIEEGLKSRSF